MARKQLPEGALGEFEERAVLGRAVKLTNLGDGLSNAVAVQPRALKIGDEVVLLVRGVVDSAEYDPIKDTEALLRTDVVKGGTIVFVDEEDVVAMLEAQEVRIDEMLGRKKLPFGEAEPADVDQLVAAHEAGEHADGLREGCPPCEAEKAAEEREAGGSRRRRRS